MGNWKKAVAAAAALPMLAAFVPAASAADAQSSTGQSQAAQAALQAAVAQTGTKAADADLLASFDFNDVKSGATGEITDQATGAKAAINGAAATATGKDGTTAAQLGSGFWLNVTKGDGSAVLKGKNAVTVSYDSKSASTNQGWAFYAAADAKAPVYKSERYLGVMDLTDSLTVQRYNNDGSGRNGSGSVEAKSLKNDWRHVDIVIEPTASTLYIDGAQVATATPDGATKQGLADILGADGGILQLGKANWVNGEYFTGAFDNLKVYGSAHSADQIKKDYEASSKTELAKADANALSLPNTDDVRSDITLPESGTVNGSKIAWTSSDPKVVTDKDNGDVKAGVVTRQKNDVKVTLTATLTGTDGSTATKTFEVTVKAAVAQPKTTDYVFAHFTGTEGSSTDEQIYFATSQDGLKWHDTRDAGDPVLTWDQSQTGNSRGKDNGVRDPYLVRSPQGDTVYLIATELSIHNRGGWGAASATSTGSKNLIIWESHDMVNWSAPRAVDVASKIPGAGMAWAPEAYWDDVNQQYMVYWATASDESNESGDHTNMYYSTTRDFVNFTTPVKWIDRSKSVIDTTMLKADDGYYYRVSGDTYLGIERSKNPYATTTTTGDTVADGYYNTSDDPNQWTLVGTFGDLTGTGLTGAKLEGPELFFYSSDDIQTNAAGKPMKYGLMWDQYSSGKGYTPYRSADLGSTDKADWGFASDVNFGSLKKRHGTILPVSTDEYNAINKAFDQNGAVTPVVPDKAGSEPIASYDFEDDNDLGKDTTGNGNALTLKGVKEHGKPGDWGTKVIQLRGDGGYAELPTGLFDGRDEFTLEFSSKSRQTSGNFFSFALGKDQNKYLFLRLRGSEAYVAITDGSWQSEQKISANVDTLGWHRYTLTVTAKHIALYVDGVLAGQVDTTVSISDFGRNVKAYFGKSFYSGDGTYNGGIDDVNVYNWAKSEFDVVGMGAALKVKDTDQVLSQNGVTAEDGSVTKSIVLDYWSDPKTGAKSDKSKVSFKYEIPEGVTVADQSGKALTAADLDKVTDYSQPLKLKLTYGGRTADYTVAVEVLVTPVRISGDQAKKSGISETDPTGSEGWKFFADPQVVAYGGKYYIFPTTDGYSGWSGSVIHAFESTDLVNWEDKGVVVNLKDQKLDGTGDTSLLPKRTSTAWAPGFAMRNGKFYLYFSGNEGKSGTNQTNVAVSDPAKGGTITSGYQIQSGIGNDKNGRVTNNIDPGVFVDPADGSYWMTWGQSNNRGVYARLNDDMMSVDYSTNHYVGSAAKDLCEGQYITARKDPSDTTGKTWIYYFTYSKYDTNDPNYRVGYAIAKGESLASVKDSDWKYQGEILSRDDAKGILGTAHHSLLQVPGTDDWYIVYHSFLTDEMRPRGIDKNTGDQIRTGNKREVRIARMTYKADGTIETVPVTYEGVLPETTPEVSVSGAAAEGETAVGTKLTAAFNDGWKLASVQWYRADDAKGANAVAIDGATAAEYTLTDADAGKTVFAKAVGENTTGVLQNAQPGTAGAVASKTDELASANTVKVGEKTVVPVDSVTITGEGVKDGKVTVGPKAGTLQLSATVNPDNATGATVEWTSSNPDVATVDQTGLVTFNAVETDTDVAITATAGGKSATVTLTVKAPGSVEPEPTPGIESVTIAGEGVTDGKLTVKEGASAQLTATVLPSDAKADIAWASSNSAVVSVDKSGKVTGVKAGTATVTATAGGKSASITVTVTKAEAVKPKPQPAAKPSGTTAATGAAVAGVMGAVALLAAAGIGLTVWRKRRA